MSQLLLLSFDCSSSPFVILKTTQSFGQGFAWYNNDELSSTIVKELKTNEARQSTLSNIMQDPSKFHSSIFIGNIHGAAKRLVQKDTQPFHRSYAGRDWIFAHAGDLQTDYDKLIKLDEKSFFEPIGSTDSEYLFCWLLEKIRKLGARSLSAVNWNILYECLREINKLGTVNIMISDGLDTIVYHDINSFNQLYYLRSTPPHTLTHINSELYSINILAPFDIHHTFILISNQNIDERCEPMAPGQMLVIRRSQPIWNSKYYITPKAEKNIKQNIFSKTLEKIIPKQTGSSRAETKKVGNKYQIQDYISNSEKMFYSVLHETSYQYTKAVNFSKHLFHLHPIADHVQTILDYKLIISVPGFGEFFEDVFGNIATYYEINSAYEELVIKSESLISVASDQLEKSETLHKKRDIPLAWLPWQRQMLSAYLLPPELPESELNELTDFAMSFVKRNDYDLMEVLKDINQTIYRDFSYVSGSTSLATTPYDLYFSRRGVCQDFTNLFICLARLLNIPARYRTGYIYTSADYTNQVQSEASHAWVELYLPYIGWYGFDPTNGCIAGKNHVRVACGRSYVDTPPTSGTIYQGGGGESLKTEVKIKLLDRSEIKRFTKQG